MHRRNLSCAYFVLVLALMFLMLAPEHGLRSLAEGVVSPTAQPPSAGENASSSTHPSAPGGGSGPAVTPGGPTGTPVNPNLAHTETPWPDPVPMKAMETEFPGREALIEDWISAIQEDNGSSRRADSVTAPGQCKQYLIDRFTEVSAGFSMAEFPNAALAMPQEHGADETVERVYGSTWEMPDPQDGNPFLEVLHYNYVRGVPLKQNKDAVRTLLESVQRGDVLQMMAIYNNGERGTHTLLITSDFDPAKKRLRWADSNFKMKYVNGRRYGVVVANQVRNLDEVMGWLLNANCGCTLYRLRDGIVEKPPQLTVTPHFDPGLYLTME